MVGFILPKVSGLGGGGGVGGGLKPATQSGAMWFVAAGLVGFAHSTTRETDSGGGSSSLASHKTAYMIVYRSFILPSA